MKNNYIIGSSLVAAAWLWCLLWFPPGLSDQHGFNQMYFVFGISAVQVFLGLAMLVAARRKRLSWPLTWSVVFAPVAHWLGVSSASPLCFIMLLGPSLLTLFCGLYEFLRYIYLAYKVQFAS